MRKGGSLLQDMSVAFVIAVHVLCSCPCTHGLRKKINLKNDSYYGRYQGKGMCLGFIK